jgi:hypothetical protein
VKFASAVGIDIVMVLVFAVIGRGSHAEANTLLGVLGTAWPFLAGTVAGSLLARAWRRPLASSTAVIVWLCTVALGMLLRLASGNTAAWQFWIVSFVSFAILLIGWRLVARAILQARGRRNTAQPAAAITSSETSKLE